MSDVPARMRWDPYALVDEDEFDSFWAARRDRGETLLVLGRGFDRRALEAARRLHNLGIRLRIWLIAFDNGLDDSPAREQLTANNDEGLVGLFGEGAISRLDVTIGGPAGTIATSRNTVDAIRRAGDLSGFADVIIDISAMPRMVAMTGVAKLLFDLDQLYLGGGSNINLHVTTAESVSADLGAQRGTLRDDVSMVSGFSGQLAAQGTETVPRV